MPRNLRVTMFRTISFSLLLSRSKLPLILITIVSSTNSTTLAKAPVKTCDKLFLDFTTSNLVNFTYLASKISLLIAPITVLIPSFLLALENNNIGYKAEYLFLSFSNFIFSDSSSDLLTLSVLVTII